MEKDNEKIIISRKYDRELYNLVNRIEVMNFGKIYFDKKEVKEITINNGKPKIITVEETFCLSND